MKINLVKANVRNVVAKAEIKLTKRKFRSIVSLADPPEGVKDFGLFGLSYMRAKTKHYAIGSLGEIPDSDKKGEYLFFLYYTINKDDLPSPISLIKNLTPIRVLIHHLSETISSAFFDCEALFDYSCEMFRSSMGLPITISEEEDSAFNEIRGFRIAKTEKDKVLYNAIVDRPDNKDISVTLNLAMNEAFSEGLPKIILDRAEGLSLNLIEQESSDK